MQEPFTIDGRKFRYIENPTVENAIHHQPLIVDLDLSQLTKGPRESAEVYANRLLAEVVRSGHCFDIVGCAIIPAHLEDSGWSPAVMRETSDFLRTRQGPEALRAFSAHCNPALINFLLGAVESFMPLEEFSTQVMAAPK